jgi:predicted thioesterase
LYLLLLPHLILLLKHSSLLGVHLLLHETAGFAMKVKAIGCWRDLMAGREMLLLLLLLLVELEIWLLMLWVCLRHRRLVHRIRTVRHADHGLIAKVLLAVHGSLHVETIVSAKILRSSAWRCTQLSHVLVEGCAWVCAGVRLRHLVAKPTGVDVRKTVKVEVVNVEDVGEVVQISVHGRHGVQILGCL